MGPLVMLLTVPEHGAQESRAARARHCSGVVSAAVRGHHPQLWLLQVHVFTVLTCNPYECDFMQPLHHRQPHQITRYPPRPYLLVATSVSPTLSLGREPSWSWPAC